jgi:hypothetical protein
MKAYAVVWLPQARRELDEIRQGMGAGLAQSAAASLMVTVSIGAYVASLASWSSTARLAVAPRCRSFRRSS